MRLIITGSNGKLGRACAHHAASLGWETLGIDRTAAPDAPCPTFVGNLLDPYTIHRAIDRLEQTTGSPIDALIHLANHINARSATPEIVLRENLAMNANVFIAAIERGAKRLVFSSSIQAFLGGTDTPGDIQETRLPPAFPIDETTPANPTNTYGLSKLLTEQMLERLAGSVLIGNAPVNTVSAVSVRLPYILGDGSFQMVRERALQGEFNPVEYRWGGSEAFAYIHERDAAAALLAAADHHATLIQGHELLWIAADEPRTWEDAATLVDRFYHAVPGAQAAAQRGSFQNITKAKRLLNWEPTHLLSAVRAQAIADRR